MQAEKSTFNPSLLCPDCNCRVKIDSFIIIARYVSNGTNIPAGNAVRFYGICPKCSDPVAMVNGDSLDIQDFELNAFIKALGEQYVRTIKPKRKKEVIH